MPAKTTVYGLLKQSPRDGKLAPRGRVLYSPLQSLERKHPGTTFTIGLHEGLKGTWMGNLVPAPSGDIMIGPDGKRVMPHEGRLQDRWDAILFLGRRAELT